MGVHGTVDGEFHFLGPAHVEIAKHVLMVVLRSKLKTVKITYRKASIFLATPLLPLVSSVGRRGLLTKGCGSGHPGYGFDGKEVAMSSGSTIAEPPSSRPRTGN